MSRTQFHPNPLPPKWTPSPTVLSLLKTAHHHLAEYRHLLHEIDRPEETLSMLLLLEAVESTEGQKTDVHATCHYLKALEFGSREIKKKKIDQKLLCTLHQIINTGSLSKKSPTTYREQQNWIGPNRSSAKDAYFFPPPPEKVKSYMNNLLAYGDKRQEDPLIQLAIYFAQFLIIHPFMDGNGRIARVLTPLFLYQHGVMDHPLFFMSHYFYTHRLDYFLRLFQITDRQNWEKWILFFLKGISEQAKQLKKLIRPLS